MRITEVKYDGSKVRIEYQIERPDGGEPDDYALNSGDKPLPSFGAALSALTQDVIAICELDKLSAAQITVRGVTITWKNDIMGACITALKSLKSANAPLVLNTPHLSAEPYSGSSTDPNPTLDTATAQRIERVADEAERYVAGERAQAALPLESPKPAAESAVQLTARRLAAVGAV